MSWPPRRSPHLDRDEFVEVYDVVGPRLLRWLRAQAGPEAARELLAETFARAWASRARFDPARGEPEAWLFGIAHKLLLSYWRRQVVEDRGRRRLGIRLDAYVEEPAEERLDAQRLSPVLNGALSALSDVVRDAVVLRVVHEHSYEEIARMRDCSAATARMRVARGLRALRDHHPIQEPT